MSVIVKTTVWLFLVIATLWIYVDPVNADVEPVLQQCCQSGEIYARNHSRCTVPESEPEQEHDARTLCLTAKYICCEKAHTHLRCEAGKEAARAIRPCPTDHIAKECCERCRFGLMVKSAGSGCNLKNFNFKPNEAFEDCCQEPESSEARNDRSLCETNSPCAQKCEQQGNRVRCSCFTGYRLASDQRTCEDIDECQLGKHNCDLSEVCENAVGGYRCQEADHNHRINQCPVGYILNEEKRTCDDVNECAYSACPPSQRCVNVVGSFHCVSNNSNINTECPPGFRFQTPIGRCVDIDECSERSDNCSRSSQMCQNNYGSYSCVARTSTRGECPAGFKFSSSQGICEDVNECTEDLADCHPSVESCRNTVGGYECDPLCPNGMRYDSSIHSCTDQDVCSSGFHNCSVFEVCVMLPDGSSFRCVPRAENDVCLPGFKPITAPDGINRICEDVNECTEFSDACDNEHEVCKNEEGSYDCLPKDCQEGFHLKNNQCVDIDECQLGLDNCNRTSSNCINRNGTFECVDKSLDRCPPGYKYGDRGCEDVNECMEGRHKCLEGQEHCENVPGAYRCRQLSPQKPCQQGRRFSIDTGSCEDINECSERTHDCNLRTQRCINTPGSYQCQALQTTQPVRCGTGYAYDLRTDTCADMNECESLRPCHYDQQCENTPGSYKCLCRQGYTLDTFFKKCIDINECQLNLHSCEHSQRCDNTVGSYSCVRVTGCGTGYTLNGETSKCEDDNECILGTHNCGPGFACRNLLGSFRCDRIHCPAGQRLLPEGSCQIVRCSAGMEPDDEGACVDVNECSRPSICRPNQRCINNIGSYHCQNLLNCGPGFEINDVGDQCLDVDECARGIHECQSDQTCRNRPGGYTCECPKGYTLNNLRQCEDIDECLRFRGQVCASNSDCINTQGSYTCNCHDGFRTAGHDKSCVDIDECLESPLICNQTCNNVWGSYQCSCKLGYTLTSDKKTCGDIDECEMYGNVGNLCVGFCVNEPGSFRCSCPSGYRLASDQRTCQDVDECSEQGVCSDEGSVCLNTRGGYKCNQIQCPPNYARDREHRNRCVRSLQNCTETTPDGARDCLRHPLSFSYNYITFVSNMPFLHHGTLHLFTMRGPRIRTTSVQFNLALVQTKSDPGKEPATREYFRLKRTAPNEVLMSLVRTIKGPQEIELDLSMKMYHNGLYGGTAVAKIFIYVTEYEF